ncbi:MAG TPA: NUDIX hydrolase [Nocardioidaceae bacterium]|nr:NUDIX hydrolase [Nocardioidaceae bacterium]
MSRQLPADQPEHWSVVRSAELLPREFVGVRRDTVTGPDGAVFDRDVVLHDDAVGVVVLDEREHVLLLGQYRHAVGHRLLEAPAGLLDVPGEPAPTAAARELAEEAGVEAADWRVLVDAFSSPGFSTEAWRVYLARDIRAIPAEDRSERQHEEADLVEHWVPLDVAVQAVLEGRITDSMSVMGLLAAWTARAGAGFDALRLVDAPWAARDR